MNGFTPEFGLGIKNTLDFYNGLTMPLYDDLEVRAQNLLSIIYSAFCMGWIAVAMAMLIGKE